MNLPHAKCRHRVLIARELFDKRNCFTMIDNFKMFAQRFAADGQPVLQNEFRFAQGQRTPLNCVRVVNPFECHLVMQTRNCRFGQRTQSIKLSLLGSDAGKQARFE
jgi:hypothetical protein